MHLIVVRRDGHGFQHLHPTLDASGIWSIPITLPDAGAYRVFADFKHDGEARTLAADLTVDGTARYRPLPEPAVTADAGHGYEVRLNAGGVRAGREVGLDFSVTRDGRAVETEPYLGARGHLVALREGDLAFLHVHPDEDSLVVHGRVPERGPLPAVPAVQAPRTCAHGRVHAGGDAMSAVTRARRAADRGHDLRVVREPDRARAERGRRRDRDGELRDRARRGRVRPGRSSPSELLGAVEAAGYSAQLPSAARSAADEDSDEDPTAPLRRRLLVSAALSLPVLLMSMVPALQFDNWQWLCARTSPPRSCSGAAGRSTRRPGRT